MEIKLYDPDNCLPRRILNLNLTGSPFKGESYQDQTFLNCSSSSSSVFNLSNISSSLLFKPISCLSSPLHTVLLVTNFTNLENVNSLIKASCELIGTVSVPVPSPARTSLHGVPRDDLILTWTNDEQSTDFSNNPPPDPPQGYNTLNESDVKYLFLGIPALVSFIWCCCSAFQGCGRGSDDYPSHNTELSAAASLPPAVPTQPVNALSGLDDSTIRSCPKVVFNESLKSNDTTCPICLSDYQLKETLRSISVCNHYFHATCIDGWLRVNATCPVCRKSLIPSQFPPAHAT
ncbi:zinc finger protein [Macleaya cordata]|uniref:RING-type E3 ubiquitin transferase n=1 Tax=Macleaya cordata TaxID=56857 RepID=A0A200R610_MACCD|nr:zinc finger protein [Macleaya cordata]